MIPPNESRPLGRLFLWDPGTHERPESYDIMKHLYSIMLKTIFISVGFVALLSFGSETPMATSASSQSSEAEITQDLKVNVTGLEGKSGIVRIALFDSESSYEADQPLNGQSLTARDSGVTFNFGRLQSGDYAFKLFLDEDRDREIDTNALGIPTEDYAFSQDASDPFSAPEWAEAKFEVSAGSEATRTISLD